MVERSNRTWTFAALALLASLSPLQGQKGYDLRDDQVVVDRRRHWEEWSRPSHLSRIDRDGSVRPRNFRGVYDVLTDKSFGRPVQLTRADPRILNIDSTMKVDFRGNPVADFSGDTLYDYVVRPGVSRAGSNVHLAKNIVDGDPSTFWEPDLNEPTEKWWVEVDLGRAVPLERLRLFFAEEALGDPFYRFILLFGQVQSNFLEDNPTARASVFLPFQGTNTDQRVFVFDAGRVSDELPEDRRAADNEPLSSSSSSPNWTGRMVEVIRIVVADTRGARAEPIAEQQWRGLPRTERGDVVYFLRDGEFEEPVDRDTYLGLPLDRRGHVDYYRRELPRLGEVEGWTRGDEIGLEMLDGGGSVELTGTGSPNRLFDGDYSTVVNFKPINTLEPGLHVLTLDLGSAVWLERILLVGGPPRGYIIRGSTGTRNARGDLELEKLSSPEHEDNVENGMFATMADVLKPARRVRFLQMTTLAHADDGNVRSTRYWTRVRDLMLFSKGPAAEVVLESGLIELPGLLNLGAVRWEADTPPGSEVQIRTRTGNQLLERIRFCDKVGNCSYTARQHKRLSFTQKGEIDTSLMAGPGWSAWSQRYQQSGDQATSPGVRRFMRIQARLINHDRVAVPRLRKISVDLLEPVAQQLAAEVWPDRVTVGVVDTFEVYVQPHFLEKPDSSASPGFDEILLRADPLIDLRLVDAALGTESELAQGQPQVLFDRTVAQGLESGDGQSLRILSQGDSLLLGLPFSVQSAPSQSLPRLYYRRLNPGDEVPTGLDGNRLSVHGFSLLPKDQRGHVRYFRQVEGAALEEVDFKTYIDLPEGQGKVRYFRIVTTLGDQTVFNVLGDTLINAQYNQLSGDERGWVVGTGLLLRLRFATTVYLHGTRLRLAVRQGSMGAAWQSAEERDVTSLRPASTLAILTTQSNAVIGDVAITPNPFTPNGDGINDEAQIEFPLFKVSAPRPVVLRVYTLNARLVRRLEHQLAGGRHRLVWDGRDDQGDLVPPGLYLCQIEASADVGEGGRRRTHLIGVAY